MGKAKPLLITMGKSRNQSMSIIALLLLYRQENCLAQIHTNQYRRFKYRGRSYRTVLDSSPSHVSIATIGKPLPIIYECSAIIPLMMSHKPTPDRLRPDVPCWMGQRQVYTYRLWFVSE